MSKDNENKLDQEKEWGLKSDQEMNYFLKIGSESLVPLTVYKNSATIASQIKHELLIEVLDNSKNEYFKEMTLKKYKDENKEFFQDIKAVELILEISESNQTIFSLYHNDKYCILANFKDHEPLCSQSKVSYDFLTKEQKLNDVSYLKRVQEHQHLIDGIDNNVVMTENDAQSATSKLDLNGKRVLVLEPSAAKNGKRSKNRKVTMQDFTSKSKFSEVCQIKPRIVDPDDIDEMPEEIIIIDQGKQDVSHVHTKETTILASRNLGDQNQENFREKYDFDNNSLFQVKKYTEHMIYEGMLDTRGFKDGFGQIVYENGSIYEGEWKSDKRDGYGRFIECETKWYLGFWKKDCKDGQGTRQLDDGRKIVGNFSNDKLNGEAEVTLPNGGYYKGFFKENVFESGTGKKILKSGMEYEGSFLNGKYSGEGIFTFEDGATYKGNFKNGSGNGFGILTKRNKVRYEGNFLNGLYDGHGKMFFTDGSKYDGLYKNGKREGKGVLTTNNDINFRQLWKDGEQVSYSDCQIF